MGFGRLTDIIRAMPDGIAKVLLLSLSGLVSPTEQIKTTGA
jgi:hypothetical protein